MNKATQNTLAGAASIKASAANDFSKTLTNPNKTLNCVFRYRKHCKNSTPWFRKDITYKRQRKAWRLSRCAYHCGQWNPDCVWRKPPAAKERARAGGAPSLHSGGPPNPSSCYGSEPGGLSWPWALVGVEPRSPFDRKLDPSAVRWWYISLTGH